MPNVDELLERPIPDWDLEILTRSCGSEPPEFVVRDYWDYRKIRDRNETSLIQPFELYALVLASMKRCGAPIHDNPAKPYPILKLASDGRIKFGDYIRVHWKGTEHKGTFVEAHQGPKTVLVLIENAERKVDANCILGPYIEQPVALEA